MSEGDRLQKAVSFTIDSGYQLDKDAFNFLNSIGETEDPVLFMKEAIRKIRDLEQKPLFINRNFLEEIKNDSCKETEENYDTFSIPLNSGSRKRFSPFAKEVEKEIKIVSDPTKKICTTGSIEEYIEYFQDRFKRLKKILQKRVDAKNSVSISTALKMKVKSKFNIIGIITEKIETKGKLFLRIEDLEATATVLVSSNLGKEVLGKARCLLLDQVICLKAIKGNNDLIIAKDIVLPEIPQKSPRKSTIPIYAALMSDIHVGSKKFMRKEFNRFILWIKGKYGNDKLKKIGGSIKYLIIAGDIVDGIGVYPGQMEGLAITDIYEQYKEASKLIEQIPDYIEVIIIPGNHDASRKSLPQPAIPKEYAESLYEARKIYSLGNPSSIKLHGVEVLLFHGRSLDDIAAVAPNIGFNNPDKSMKLLMQGRHLAPIYGERTPIAPEKRDFMVIEKIPDIFHTGHVHVLKSHRYRGTLMVNSGAWQHQTDFQKKMGLFPTPGILPIVNLQTLDLLKINFV